jgi:hypothetical protein
VVAVGGIDLSPLPAQSFEGDSLRRPENPTSGNATRTITVAPEQQLAVDALRNGVGR